MKEEGARWQRTPWLPADRSGAPVARSTVKSTANALEYFFLVGRERKGDHERARGTWTSWGPPSGCPNVACLRVRSARVTRKNRAIGTARNILRLFVFFVPLALRTRHSTRCRAWNTRYLEWTRINANDFFAINAIRWLSDYGSGPNSVLMQGNVHIGNLERIDSR